MDKDARYIARLIYLSLANELSGEQLHELESWLSQSPRHQAFYEELQHDEWPAADLHPHRPTDELGLEQELFSIIRQQTGISPATKVRRISRWAWVAASVLLLAPVAVYLVVSYDRPATHAVQLADIEAGKSGAVLTLADGSQVSLDTFKNATVALQNGVTAKVVNGLLVYEGKGDVVAYNTMSTPKGRQFHLMLPDGTLVWLNAASSIRYPTIFKGGDRRVEITGEAYFEVARNPKIPFRLNVNDRAAIEVLGTHFNVNAYENEEQIKTTLIEGSVKVAVASPDVPAGSFNRPVILNAGQQAQVSSGKKTQAGQSGLSAEANTANSRINVINNADIDKVMAWKNGIFNFKDNTLEEVMRQIERWYDIEVVYENGVPDVELAGEITKDVSLNGLLKNFEKLGVHYRLEGRKLIVLPTAAN